MLLQKPLDDFRNFLYTQYFSDGIKITIGVLLPSLIFAQFNLLEIGINLSLGAVCCSISDTPGPWLHRRNAMLITNFLVFLVALITSLINHNPILIGIEILVFCFIFSMFYVYGTRASSVGTAALLIMVLNVAHHETSLNSYEHAGLVLSGGIWYFLLSALFSFARPFRYARQTLGECVQEVAGYMRLRADFYNAKIPVEDIFKALVDKQVLVHEIQDNVREILFKTRKLVNESTSDGRLLIMIFVDIVDLFEQTMATHHDYEIIRKRYKNHDILPAYALLIHKLASEIEYIGFCLINQVKPRKYAVKIEDLDKLKKQLDDLEKAGISVLVLKKILVNLRHIFSKTNTIFSYFDNDNSFIKQAKSGSTDHDKFVTHQSFDIKLFRSNLNLMSGNFRYALRVSLVVFTGYLVGFLLPVGHHSYWIILTILVILKPGFSTTKQRNIERVIGTIIGGITGALIIYFIKDETARFILMVLFMLITYSIQRVNYFISVLFMTPFILILFSFISATINESLAVERIIDTLIGSGIAFLSSYLVLPSWESYQFKNYMLDMLKANQKYLDAIFRRFNPQNQINITEYKLARKEVYVNTANLAAAFQRMLNEPKTKQHKAVLDVHKFVVLNHILSSYLANLSTSLQDSQIMFNTDQQKLFRKSQHYLKLAIEWLSETTHEQEFVHVFEGVVETNEDLATEQLELIVKVSADILKITEKL